MVTAMTTRNWRDLIRPKAIQIEPDSANEFYGKFTCEPLERGYGITIGNSLRRGVPSSLHGAAGTAAPRGGGAPHLTNDHHRPRGVAKTPLHLKRKRVKAGRHPP